MDEKYIDIDPIYERMEDVNNEQLSQQQPSEPTQQPSHTHESNTGYRTYQPVTSDSNYSEPQYRRYDDAPQFSTGGGNQTPPPKQPKKKHRFPRFVAMFVIFVFLGGAVFGAGYSTALHFGNQLTPELASTTSSLNFDVNQISPVVSSNTKEVESGSTVAAIAKNVGPSVVTISSKFQVASNNFFNQQTQEVEGTGSGIIYKLRDKDLLIITNHHVIADATDVEVTFHDGTSLAANIIGYDSRMDLAVLSIPLSAINESGMDDITVATFGDSSALEVGELAVAIGNPLGKEFSSTVTAGVISAVNRELTLENTKLTVLQTDAAINPGNSGGALVDSKGEVIGINTAKYVDEKVEGMGFSIPVHLALPVIKTIIESGNGSDVAYAMNDDKPFLGVGISDISNDVYAQTGMPFGVYVTNVYAGSAADKAGIMEGDVIYSINGDRIANTNALFDTLSTKSVGDTLEISVSRGEKLLTLNATLTRYGDVETN